MRRGGKKKRFRPRLLLPDWYNFIGSPRFIDALFCMIDSRRLSLSLSLSLFITAASRRPVYRLFLSILSRVCSIIGPHAIVSFCRRREYWLRTSKTYPLDSLRGIVSARYFSKYLARKWSPLIEFSSRVLVSRLMKTYRIVGAKIDGLRFVEFRVRWIIETYRTILGVSCRVHFVLIKRSVAQESSPFANVHSV